MRRLLWFTIGFVMIAALFAYLFPIKFLFYFCGIGLLCAIPIVLLRNKLPWWRIFIMFISGAITAALWISVFQAVYWDTANTYHEKEIAVEIEASDYSAETKYGVSCEGYVFLDGKRYKVRFYLNDDTTLMPGDLVKGTFEFRSTISNEKANTNYYQGEGIYLIAYPRDITRIDHSDTIPVKYLPAKIRFHILHTIDTVFPEDTAGFARALLLGDTSLLTYEQDVSYKVSGIRHIVAVSGLHVSILFAFVYVLAGKHRVLTAVFGIPVLVLFAAVAGFTPSVMRACIMQCLMIFAMLVDREYDAPSALSFAVLVMVISNPLAITSVSLQLSAGCMVGIFLFSRKISNFLLSDKCLGPSKGNSLIAKIKRWFAGSVSVSVGAMITTTPLCALYFETVSLVGIITNLLVLWAVSLIYYAIMAACLFSLFFMPIGSGIAWVSSWLIRFVQFVSRSLSALPFAAVYTCSKYIVFWLVFSYVLLVAFFIMKKKHPFVMCSCILFMLVLSVGLSCIEPRTDDYRISVLDVGQGQSILIQSDGENYLVDCGGDYGQYAANKAAQLLLSQGINRLDGIILTHFDEDHIGGIPFLLSRVSTDSLYITAPNDNEVPFTEDAEFPVYTVRSNITTELGKGSLTVYAPKSGSKGNESSLCVLFQTDECGILITGDRTISAEKYLIENSDIPNVDILVVGHHGADTSTSLDLLRATKPSVAVISVGADNRYGHPQKKVLDKLSLFGCKVYRTDIYGTIVFRG